MTEKAKRRQYTVAYKLKTLQEADACTKKGELGALLRREGLYSSHLASWRAALAKSGSSGMEVAKRGPKAAAPDPRGKVLVEQQGEVARWKARAERAEAIVDIQEKVASLLGIELPLHTDARMFSTSRPTALRVSICSPTDAASADGLNARWMGA